MYAPDEICHRIRDGKRPAQTAWKRAAYRTIQPHAMRRTEFQCPTRLSNCYRCTSWLPCCASRNLYSAADTQRLFGTRGTSMADGQAIQYTDRFASARLFVHHTGRGAPRPLCSILCVPYTRNAYRYTPDRGRGRRCTKDTLGRSHLCSAPRRMV